MIGLSFDPATGETDYLTLAPADLSPIVTGCVFRDANGNGKYDVGEGLSGVTITVNGQQSVQDFDSGGYTIAVKKPGPEQVTASGGGLPGPITETVVATKGRNVRLNFVVSWHRKGGSPPWHSWHSWHSDPGARAQRPVGQYFAATAWLRG